MGAALHTWQLPRATLAWWPASWTSGGSWRSRSYLPCTWLPGRGSSPWSTSSWACPSLLALSRTLTASRPFTGRLQRYGPLLPSLADLLVPELTLSVGGPLRGVLVCQSLPDVVTLYQAPPSTQSIGRHIAAEQFPSHAGAFDTLALLKSCLQHGLASSAFIQCSTPETPCKLRNDGASRIVTVILDDLMTISL